MTLTALYITLCFTSHAPAVCEEGTIVPGGGQAPFVSEQACHAGQDAALQYWFDKAAGPVFGITAMVGDGYEIKNLRCGPLVPEPHGS